MRICFVAMAGNYHTQKWVSYFMAKGHDVHVATLDNADMGGCVVHRLESGATAESSDFGKIAYLTQKGGLARLLDELHPDVINAHYASSYGTLTALACKQPYILSIWGSDIYDFPKKSVLHRAMIQYSLNRASLLLSTSNAMALEASKYTRKPLEITPFGVDTTLFKPRNHSNDKFVLATVKALAKKYGIDVLLKALADVVNNRPDIKPILRIAGKGPQEQELRKLASSLGVADYVEWLGFINQQEAAEVWASADVAVVPSSSLSESFGVSAVEAQSCGVPVIVSDVPGLLESTIPGKSSLVFPRGDHQELANRIIQLHDKQELRMALGRAGRRNVLEKYSYDKCFERIEEIFLSFAHRQSPK